MWSKGYRVTDTEILELHSAMDRHDGLFYLAAGAGFVADHKAQGDRIDFGHLFKAYRYQFSFLVGGSNEDPFEHRQVDFAQERLGNLGLQIERLPGGHLTTNEQPEALAALIAKLERGLVRKPERAGGAPGTGRTQRPDVAVEVPPGLRPQRKLSLGNLSAKHTRAGLSA